MTDQPKIPPHSRRDFIRTATVSAGAAAALFGGFGINPVHAAEMAKAVGRSEKPLKAAFSNAGLQATWCAQGKQAAEYWGSLFNVEVTWFDGQLDAVQAARGDRQHGFAEMGLRRHPGVRHRHADPAGAEDDRRRHAR
jgi:hypothetical protein